MAASMLPRGTTSPFHFVDDEAVNFIDNVLPLSDSNFQQMISVQYDPLRQAYAPDPNTFLIQNEAPSPSQLEVQIQSDSLRRAIGSFLESKKGSDVQLQELKSTSWQDVLTVVEDARVKYRDKAKKDKSIVSSLRGRLRSFDKPARAMENWLKLLPSDSWQGSLVCGGIKIVLQSAIRMGELREDICDAIELIPEVIANTQEWSSLYRGRKTLQANAASLYVAVLEILELCLSWLAKKPLTKFASELLKGGEYGRKLKDAIGKLESLRERIREQAEIAHHTYFAQGINEIVQIKSGVLALLQDRKKQRFQEAEINRLYEDIREQNLAMNRERKGSLLRALGYNPSLAPRDLEKTLFVDTWTFNKAQDRVASLLQSAELTHWLASRYSSTLIMNGHERPDTDDSATSLFTAMFLKSVQKSAQGTIIHWFCTRHKESHVSYMIRNLIGQLVHTASEDMEILNSNSLDRLDDIGALTQILTTCLKRQLDHGPVYCIIDAISCYEDQYRRRDICYVFGKLAALRRRSSGHLFKLLVTSSGRAFDICESTGALDATVFDAPDEVFGALYQLEEVDILQHTEACLDPRSRRRVARANTMEDYS